MRKAKVENKYNLKFNDLKKLKVIIPNNKKPPNFSRCVNNIKGWQFSENTAKTKADREYASYSSYQIIIYDEGIKKDRVEVTCSAFGDICNYLFDEFFNYKDIENKDDLEIQEKLLAKINNLIDNNILSL